MAGTSFFISKVIIRYKESVDYNFISKAGISKCQMFFFSYLFMFSQQHCERRFLGSHFGEVISRRCVARADSRNFAYHCFSKIYLIENQREGGQNDVKFPHSQNRKDIAVVNNTKGKDSFDGKDWLIVEAVECWKIVGTICRAYKFLRTNSTLSGNRRRRR